MLIVRGTLPDNWVYPHGSPDANFSKWVAPESLAEVIAFLLSDGARDISGASLPVYGRT